MYEFDVYIVSREAAGKRTF